MLLKLAALGAIGYVGYQYLQKNGGFANPTSGGSGEASTGVGALNRDDPHLAVAGGRLSDEAVVVHSADPLPAT
jgi:hypothetical protein